MPGSGCMSKTVGIVGGAGFLGNRLAKRLAKSGVKYSVFDVDVRDEADIALDVTDIDSLSVLSDCDVLINLAAVHRDDVKPVSLYDDVNVTGARNICEAARRYNIRRIIFTSSVAVYGFSPPNTGEDGEPNYFNHYGRTKYAAEAVYRDWFDEDPENRMLLIIRPTVIFGEGNRGNVYNLLKQIASRRFVMFGDGRNIKSMAYVENVAAYLEFGIGLDRGYHLHNYIDKPDIDMNTLVSRARMTLFNTDDLGMRMPSFMGKIIGYCADLLALVIRRPLPVSAIRVKKFMATTQFATNIDFSEFKAPATLQDGLDRTLKYEFLEDNEGEAVFFTD